MEMLRDREHQAQEHREQAHGVQAFGVAFVFA
jgi:hypothetical protein